MSSGVRMGEVGSRRMDLVGFMERTSFHTCSEVEVWEWVVE
jgi:hypothetical protein